MEEQTQNNPQGLTLMQDQPKAMAERQTYSAGPAGLLEMAVARGADLAELKELMALKREVEAHEARKAFVEAMAQFKASPPEIKKDKHVEYTTDKGKTSYWHASIGGVVKAITAALAEVGISHRWETDQSSQDGRIKVTCTITHRMGHSESAWLMSSADKSGGKNDIQGIGSTITYLQRYTLLAVTGVATHDQPDDDGRDSEKIEVLNSNQVTEIKNRIKEYGLKTEAFLKWGKVDAIENVPAAHYQAWLNAIEETRQRKEEAKGVKA